MRVRASARVQVTIEVRLSSAWEQDSSVGQVHKQAAAEAVNAILARMNTLGTVVGTPKVVFVTVEEDG